MPRRLGFAALALALLVHTATPSADVTSRLAPGYLPEGAAPDSLAILPAPPAAGSAPQARDDEAARAAIASKDSPRWIQAAQDADLRFPGVAETYSCAMGVQISPSATPRLYRLLQRTMADIGRATYPTKNKFQRIRPFVALQSSTCTPDQEDFLRHDGSYPSGHSAVGWGWGLILAEIAPDHQDEILARARVRREPGHLQCPLAQRY